MNGSKGIYTIFAISGIPKKSLFTNSCPYATMKKRISMKSIGFCRCMLRGEYVRHRIRCAGKSDVCLQKGTGGGVCPYRGRAKGQRQSAPLAEGAEKETTLSGSAGAAGEGCGRKRGFSPGGNVPQGRGQGGICLQSHLCRAGGTTRKGCSSGSPCPLRSVGQGGRGRCPAPAQASAAGGPVRQDGAMSADE